METITERQPINLKVVRFQLDFTPALIESKPARQKKIRIPKIHYQPKQLTVPAPPQINFQQKLDVKDLVERLLEDLYCSNQGDWNSSSGTECRGPISVSSFTSSQYCKEKSDAIEKSYLEQLDISALRKELADWQLRLEEEGLKLARCARARDRFRRKQKRICAAFSILLRHLTGDSNIRFSVSPATDNLGPGEGGYAEWLHAMRLVARLPAGVPQHFRKKLWLTLSERYLKSKGVDWTLAERACFRGTAQPDDTELGAQILKDLHRTGCSLFCGTEGRENQAMLRRVLLAYARWNKDVGYCQGFNMLAAIILEVMEKSESDSLKVMIYLVEAVLPEGYFADDLRGLSADMAAFRDLLRLRLPRLAQHMDHLQKISDGGGVEPPLPDVFTMQWFLTLYATWLPRESLLRIWDLVLLDGNEILLLTALAIWDMLQDQILSARSADEYYSSMGGGAGAVWEASEALVAKVVALGTAPELPRLRNIHRYRVAPPVAPVPAQPPFQSAMQSMTKRGLRLFYSEDEGDSSDDGNKMALATVIPRRDERLVANDRLSLDIGALKRQYARLRERQRQAHVILAAACARHAAVGVPTSPTSLTVNNLLLGKSAIVSTRGRRLGPPPGAIPPSRRKSRERQDQLPSDEQAETISWNEEHNRKSLSRRNSVKWKDIKKEQEIQKSRKTSIDFDETGDGVIVSEREANEMMKSLRNKSCDESSSYSSHSESSSDTSLCDNDKDSDSEPEIPKDSENRPKKTKRSPLTSKSSPDIANEVLKSDRATSSTTDIASFIKSSAGEPLRDYIGAFEYKLRESTDTIPLRTDIDSENLESPLHHDFILENIEKKSTPAKSNIKFTDLNPIDIMPYNLEVNEKSPIKFDLEQSFKRPQNIDLDVNFSQPDIIDSFTMYPNFVPDIDLSENNILDIESPPRSLDSVVISEDEPPIELKIDKYFEDSPEFFGARITVTDSDNTDIKSRRPSRRQFRITKKTDSLNIERSTNGEHTILNTSERASSMPQSHSFSEKHNKPFESPSDLKTNKPFESPSDFKTNKPFESPSDFKTNKPFENPNDFKTNKPFESPSDLTTNKPFESPSDFKTNKPFDSPSDFKTNKPFKSPSDFKTNKPFESPNDFKTNKPFESPSDHKTNKPFESPSDFKTNKPFESPSHFKTNLITKREENKETCTEEYNQRKKEEEEISNAVRTAMSPTDLIISGRKNSEKALQIIQENSKILSRILTKQSMSSDSYKILENDVSSTYSTCPSNKDNVEITKDTIKSPITLKESNSDSLIRYRKSYPECKNEDKNNTVLHKSLDDRYNIDKYEFKSDFKSPSLDTTINKTDVYGWENKGFLARCDPIIQEDDSNQSDIPCSSISSEPLLLQKHQSNELSSTEKQKFHTKDELELSILPESTQYPYLNKYTEYYNTNRTSDICSSTIAQGPANSEHKIEDSQVSDFAHVVTSSISFTYERSADDESPAKSNSSDTLCQITSLDQVSTPISPKIFPRDTQTTTPKDFVDRSEKTKDSDDTYSAITSLLDSDTLSSLSYPRSPSTGSFYPFPTRPGLKMPKEIGVRLGMYAKDKIESPTK